MTAPRILVTGADGFVGRYVRRLFSAELPEGFELLETGRSSHAGATDRAALDVTDPRAVAELVTAFQPTHVLNLAGIATTADAATRSEKAWAVHLGGVRNIATAIQAHCPDCVLLQAGSGLIYGATAASGEPLDETSLLAPVDEYGVTKAAADLLLGALAVRGLRCVRFRPFNHIGPGQSEGFVVPAFAAQIARIEAGFAPPRLMVGNLDAARDFLDVRDVVRAYALAVVHSDALPQGVVLNLASGRPRVVRDVMEGLLAASNVPIGIDVDPARMRPADLPVIVGDAARARALLGWAPRYDVARTLLEVLAEQRETVLAKA